MWKAFQRQAPSLSSSIKRHTVHRTLPTHPLHLFRIIQDVDQYQNFIPYCIQSTVLRTHPDGRTFDGKLIIGYPSLFFTEEYVSRVQVNPESMTITANSIESHLFDSLSSKWALEGVQGPQDDGEDLQCEVHFEVAIHVSNPIISRALDAALPKIAEDQVKAFAKRCQQIEYPPGLVGTRMHETAALRQ